ncbi:MAG: BamA/TamA family outer membrane protein [Bacteroidetes bacterium]|nr:BamA/TamA family outer membrane protein [Bacteroidota bacterium]
MKTKLLAVTVALMLAVFPVSAQEGDGADQQKNEKVKTGWTFGALPAVSYNTDLGFQYGALVNLFNFGDGSSYPKYMHSLYAEVSRYTKGSGINRFFIDSEHLIPNIRTTVDISYLTDKALDFFGFNGYEAVFNPEWQSTDEAGYITRMFYRHERNTFKATADFQGKLGDSKFRWVAGAGLLKHNIGPVDIARLNKGRDSADMLPNVPGLYQKYVEWGVIKANEKDGGWGNHIKIGLVYDTRDFEPNPMKGIWSEVVLFVAPEFLGNGDFGFTKISATHRQYFTLVEDKLSFVYHVNYQGTILGKAPFYMQPYVINSFNNSSNIDGLGGSKSLRGVVRNRVVGDGMAFANAEFRWKVFRTRVLNQNFYLGLNAFADAGRVVQKMDLDKSGVPDTFVIGGKTYNKSEFFSNDDEGLHTTAGAGLRFVLNENFIVAVDYGRAFDKRDGKAGLYIGLNYLF